MLDADLLELAKDISSELYAARESGKMPVAIVVDRTTCARLEAGSLGSHWRSGEPELFNLPLMVEADAKGWAVRTR